MVGVQDVLDAAQQVLDEHLGSFVQEHFRRTGLQLAMNRPVRQLPVFEIDALAAADALDLPSLALSSPGLAAGARPGEGGTYDATWELVATIVCRGETADETARQARAWGLVVRTCLLAHSGLNGFGSLRWADESYTPIPVKSARTLGGAVVVFQVEVDHVAAHGRVGLPVATTSTHLDVHPYGPTHPALVEGTP